MSAGLVCSCGATLRLRDWPGYPRCDGGEWQPVDRDESLHCRRCPACGTMRTLPLETVVTMALRLARDPGACLRAVAALHASLASERVVLRAARRASTAVAA